MTRRSAVKRAMLLAIGMALGKLDTVKATGGQLTVDLDQWAEVIFKHKGKTIRVPVSDIFSSLAS